MKKCLQLSINPSAKPFLVWGSVRQHKFHTHEAGLGVKEPGALGCPGAAMSAPDCLSALFLMESTTHFLFKPLLSQFSIMWLPQLMCCSYPHCTDEETEAQTSLVLGPGRLSGVWTQALWIGSCTLVLTQCLSISTEMVSFCISFFRQDFALCSLAYLPGGPLCSLLGRQRKAALHPTDFSSFTFNLYSGVDKMQHLSPDLKYAPPKVIPFHP